MLRELEVLIGFAVAMSIASEERPEQARIATSGLYLTGVFSAIGVAVVNHYIFRIAKAPRYNAGS